VHELCKDWILDFLDFLDPTPAASNRIRNEVFFALAGAGLNLDFMFAGKTSLVVCLTYIYQELNRSRFACVMLVPDQEWIRSQNLQNRIGSGLKKFRVHTLLVHMHTFLIMLEARLSLSSETKT